ncbi:MAG: FAD-dependent oxidoreductase [Candidatus Latescibacterota bacterium]
MKPKNKENNGNNGNKEKVGAVMVVGGGIAGIQASLDLAESGFKVVLVEKSPTIGGTMAQLDKTFPTNDCAMCIMSPKLVECGRHLNIESMTCSEVEAVSGEAGHFTVAVRKKARYIDLARCTGCGDCAEACPVKVDSEFEVGMTQRKAVYRPFPQAFPNAFAIQKEGMPPCRIACPAHINAQGYIALISAGKFRDALNLVREVTPFAGVLGRVCTHPCETVCRRGEYDDSLAIASLKRLLGDEAIKSGTDGIEKPELRFPEDKVAVVGAGPAGLNAAYDLARQGYPVTVFEALPVAGGMLRVGIPDYRLPVDILEREVDLVRALGVEIRTNTRIGSDVTLEELKTQGYKSILLAVGAHKGRRLGIEGEHLSGVMECVEFLRWVNLERKPEGDRELEGQRVAIIGGGNAAIDAARSALRLGAKQVTIVYRRSRAEMPANDQEIVEAEAEGVQLLYLAAPLRIVGTDRVSGLECNRMALGDPDASGRRRPEAIDGSEFTLEVDTVISAISQSADLSFLSDTDAVKATRWGTIEVDARTGATSAEGFFAAGDATSGPATAIEAIAAGRRAARTIDQYLRGEKIVPAQEMTEPEQRRVFADFMPEAPRIPTEEAPLDRRIGSFDEAELGYQDTDKAKEEALRCLNCGVCSECLACERACKAEAVSHDMEDEVVDVEVGSIILAPGFEEFDGGRKYDLGYSRYADVVTSIQFERILSASGPFQGHVRRPSDSRMPERIAFLQCVGSRDESCDHPYCSSVCCMYAIKEAVIAKEHEKGVNPTIFFMDMRAHGKDFDRYVGRANAQYGVRFVRSRVSDVREVGTNGDRHLEVRYETEDGRAIWEPFDMVVLSVGLEPQPKMRELAERMGIQLNEYGFCLTTPEEPLATSRPGIFVCGAASGPKDIPETVMQASGAVSKAAGLLADARGTLVREKVYPPEIPEGAIPRIGVFVCHCGINIGGTVRVPDVVEYARGLSHVVYAEANLYTCSQDTQEKIKEVILEHGLNRVIVASCSPRTHEPLFQETLREAGLNPYLFEMANIRDQCSWVHMGDPDGATQKARDLVRMAVRKARLLEPLKKMTLKVHPGALVIGGGVAGMTAALSLSEQGFDVSLVESDQELGGNLRNIRYTLDGETSEFFRSLVDRVHSDARIDLHTGTDVEMIEGYVGNFTTRLSNGNGGVQIQHGVVIVATGAEELRTSKFLYGQDARVLSQLSLEEKLAEGAGTRFPSLPLRELEQGGSVVMIQCVGSRDAEHPYCSRTCCREAIKNARLLKAVRPDLEVYILYRDIRTYGFQEAYYKQAREEGIIFIRYEEHAEPEVARSDGKLSVTVTDPILGARLKIGADWVILSLGTIAREENHRIAQMLKVPLNEDGFFLEAHVKLRPVDFATEGVFVCGTAHAPKSIDETIAQAYAAAARASTVLSRDTIEAEGKTAQVNERRCVGCGMCEAVCPYRAVEVDSERMIAVVNEVICKGCGACSATCRSGAIDVRGFADEQILAAIDAL